jgi:hypothetical protein
MERVATISFPNAMGINPPVVDASALTLYIRYIYFWNLQYMYINNVIVNNLPPSGIGDLDDFGYPV